MRLLSTMSRVQKISLILNSKSSLPLYKDLSEITDRELNREIKLIMSRLARNESAHIARMNMHDREICLN